MSEAVEFQLVNAKHDLASFFLGLKDKAERWGRSPQGSCCIYQTNHQENVDASKACIHKLVIPPNAKINHIRIWCYGEKYRSYEQGIEAKAPDTVTSEATIPPTVTSGASNPNTSSATTPSTVTSAVSNPTSSASEDHTHTLEVRGYGAGQWNEAIYIHPYPMLVTYDQGGSVTTDLDWDHYDPKGGPHVHSANHSHTCPGSVHTHNMPHTHNCPGSTHKHTVNMIAHSHDLTFGIYEAASTTAQISLIIKDPDGNNHDLGVLGTGEFSKEDLEVTEYFSKTGVYTFTFSSDALGRVRSIVFAQIYLEPD